MSSNEVRMNSAHRHYFYSGLHICSEWAIDQWAAFEKPDSATPDLSIRYAEPDFQCRATDYIHELPKIGRFVLREGREIVVIREGDFTQRQLNLYLTASVWGGFCYQRGLHLLHGSAIRLKGQSFAFSGHSGAGKSTLAAILARRGYETISDDTCRIEAFDNRIWLYPSSRRFKLWGESLRALGWDLDFLEQETPEFDKFQIPMPGNAIVDRQPLRAAYLIGWGDLEIQRLIGAEALQAFLESATYWPEFLAPLGRTQAFVQSAIQVVSLVPIFKLTRPRDLTAMDGTIDLLERHWEDEFPQA